PSELLPSDLAGAHAMIIAERAARVEAEAVAARAQAVNTSTEVLIAHLKLDVNDAERLRHDPAMRWIVGGKAAQRSAASPSQMGRFETQWLATDKNFSALADLSGQWIELVHARRPPRGIVLDMDSSESPTHGEQEMSVWNGHYACTCYHPPFVFNQFGDL